MYHAALQFRAPKYKTVRSACEVLVVKNTKGEQWTAKPQAHRKQNIRALYLEALFHTSISYSYSDIYWSGCILEYFAHL